MTLDVLTELTIYEAQNIKDVFLELLNSKENIILDMKNIEKIDMVGIQLLISLTNSLSTQNISVEFINLQDSVLEHINVCYCSDILGVSHG